MIRSATVAQAIVELGSGRIEGALPSAFTGAAIDSRLVQPGNLFFALRGERTHGARFVNDAVARGATAAVVEADAFPNDAVGCPLVVVDSSVRAIQQIGRAHRLTLRTTIVGVTGSVGKTTTKELTAAVLSLAGEVHRTDRNYNNELGLPLTLLAIDHQHRFAVLEMGMDGLGQIACLAELALPSVGVVTNVGPVHLELLGSLENIQRAKSELPQALDGAGTAVLNADDPRVRQMAEWTPARVVTFGVGEAADVRVWSVRDLGFAGVSFKIEAFGEARDARLGCLGAHNAINAAAAAAVGLDAGLTLDQVVEGLGRYSDALRLVPVPGRSGVTILDDCYNASPASVVAALDTLAGLDGRRIAVLGDMKELGTFEREGHRLVGERAARTAAVLITVGPLGAQIAAAARAVGHSQVHAVQDPRAALDVLDRELTPGDIVLVKGSHSMHLEDVVAELRA